MKFEVKVSYCVEECIIVALKISLSEQCVFLPGNFPAIVSGPGPRRHVAVVERSVLDGSSGKRGITAFQAQYCAS